MTVNLGSTDELVELFASPSLLPETDYDRKAVSDATVFEIPFEGMHLAGYSWGTGQTVLLAHGWASRASHMVPLGRVLVKAGFRVVAFDQPAHGHSLKQGRVNRSSMLEFARAIAAVGQAVGPLHGLVGHSIGGAAAALAVGGSQVIPGIQIAAERLVMISSPASALSVIESYCREKNLQDRKDELIRGIEAGYGFPIEAYAVAPSLKHCTAHILIIHDRGDVQVSFEDATHLHASCPASQLMITEGLGHGEILGNRAMLKAVRDFLVEGEERR